MILPESLQIREAVDDLKKRSLAVLRGDIAQLVYVAGTRDYNTGQYYHDGLAACFTPEIASKALAQCHQECFRRVVEASMRELVTQLDEYIKSNRAPVGFISIWLSLEPYRVLTPLACDPFSAKLFCSNFKIALSILESRARK